MGVRHPALWPWWGLPDPVRVSTHSMSGAPQGLTDTCPQSREHSIVLGRTTETAQGSPARSRWGTRLAASCTQGPGTTPAQAQQSTRPFHPSLPCHSWCSCVVRTAPCPGNSQGARRAEPCEWPRTELGQLLKQCPSGGAWTQGPSYVTLSQTSHRAQVLTGACAPQTPLGAKGRDFP